MSKRVLTEMAMLSAMASQSGSGFNYFTGNYNRSYSDTPLKDNPDGAKYLIQPKKLRKGAGHRKLTRAERRKTGYEQNNLKKCHL